MQKVICDSYEQMSKKAAQMIADAVKEKPELILGLPTGGTPVGMYAEISRIGTSSPRLHRISFAT